MPTVRIWGLTCIAGAGLALGGCVAEAPLTVAPGPGKTYADLQRDDADCRGPAPAPATTTPATAASSTAATSAPGPDYFKCMQAKGELVVAQRSVPYPVYAPYPDYPYPYGYPYGLNYPYPYYGYPGLPGYYGGPYVGIGIGFGGVYGGGWRGPGWGGPGWRGPGWRGPGFAGRPGPGPGFRGGGGGGRVIPRATGGPRG